MNRNSIIYLLFGVLALFAVSCSESEDLDEYVYVKSSNVAVTSFSLESNDKILHNLDSVHFTIDLQNRLIFNADSLPVGTKITKLVTKITFPVVSSIEMKIKDGEVMKNETLDYTKHEKDSIDFTGDVKLIVVSEDMKSSAEYTVKVNVHKMKPDSLYWNQMARRNLPAYTEPLNQKTVKFKDNLYCLIREAKQYLMSTVANPSSGKWNISKVVFSFEPQIGSFTAGAEAMFILDKDGALYQSANGVDWNATGSNFYSLIGDYKGNMCGVIKDGNVYKHDIYPRPAGYTPVEVDAKFPISGFSQTVYVENKWQTSSQMLFIGGLDQNGRKSGEMWGFDGENWAQTSDRSVPGATGMTLFPYYNFIVSTGWVTTKYNALIAVGGNNEKGEVVKNVYISYDNGVNWKLGDDLLQFPTYIPAFSFAQAFVLDSEMVSRSADSWEYFPSKDLPVWNWVVTSPLSRSGNETKWDCPYVYLVGGVNAQGELYNNIWKGVINRLSFKPLY